MFASTPVFWLIPTQLFRLSLWELKGQGGTNSLLLIVCVLQKCVFTIKSSPISIFFLSAFMSQVHYFVIIINPKSRGLSSSLWKLNIAFKSQFPWWDYAKQPVRVSSSCFHSWLIHPPPWCISSFAVVYPIHLKMSFFRARRRVSCFLFPTLHCYIGPDQAARVTACIYIFLLQPFKEIAIIIIIIKKNSNPKSYYSSKI